MGFLVAILVGARTLGLATPHLFNAFGGNRVAVHHHNGVGRSPRRGGADQPIPPRIEIDDFFTL